MQTDCGTLQVAQRSLTLFLSATALALSPLAFLLDSSARAERGRPPAEWPAAQRRARDLGLPFPGQPGRYNAITDVPGVEVGHTTLIRGEGPLIPGKGPVRTGVTAIFPGSKTNPTPHAAAIVSLNGNGEVTGSHWVLESGTLETPIVLTNTHSVGVAHEAVIEWGNRHFPPQGQPGMAIEAFSLPVIAETYDGYLNDINGHHVKKEHVYAALDGAQSGPVAEGSVGGGTGMACGEWKSGIGTASRLVKLGRSAGTVGVLVQANFGVRHELMILGVPVGRELPENLPGGPAGPRRRAKDGSIIVVIGTDLPLLPHQLTRLARRASLGLGRLGAIAHNGSGDLFIAFGRAVPTPGPDGTQAWAALPNAVLDPVFEAVVQATEEAVVNSLIVNQTMVGISGNTVHALPHDRLLEVMRKYGIVPTTEKKPPQPLPR